MKQIYVLILFVMFAFGANAQIEKQIEGKTITADDKKKLEDTTQGWKFGGMGGVNFNQAAFVNWAAGGVNAISLIANARFYADYKKGKHLVQNWFAAEYGLQFSKQTFPKVNKNADRWEVFSKYGYKIQDKLYVGAYANLRSQFSNTYKYNDDSSRYLVSTFASPLIFEGAIGLDYIPNKYLSFFFSPLATKVTYVRNDSLANAEVYGNKSPKHTKAEFGATLIAQYKQDFWKQNITVSSIFRAYKNYLRADIDPIDISIRETKSSYRKNIDIDWQTTLGFKVNKFITASVFTHLIWDHDVRINRKDKETGKSIDNTEKPRLQFRDVIGIGLVYQTNYYKAKDVKAIKL
ncbi:MAG: DUF3078 domain-containing protein [Sphingobacteriales bacterium]|nr:MAG: DUF3078 domain-containing protein [Sphingobacteriales bacterium]